MESLFVRQEVRVGEGFRLVKLYYLVTYLSFPFPFHTYSVSKRGLFDFERDARKPTQGFMLHAVRPRTRLLLRLWEQMYKLLRALAEVSDTASFGSLGVPHMPCCGS